MIGLFSARITRTRSVELCDSFVKLISSCFTDHTSPALTCPKDQTLPNDKGKNTATVNWNFDFDDNSLKAGAPGISKDKFTVVIMVNDVQVSKKPEQLKIGIHRVLYKVTDLDQNYRICLFIVTVRGS